MRLLNVHSLEPCSGDSRYVETPIRGRLRTPIRTTGFLEFRCALLLLTLLTSIACGGGGGGSGRIVVSEFLKTETIPVKMAFAPDGRLFFTELATGAVRIVTDGSLQETPFAVVSVPQGTGDGLTGIALDPDFEETHRVFLYYTSSGEQITERGDNRLVSYEEHDGMGINEHVLLSGIPSGGHNGGALLFDTDASLLVSTGDAGNPANAQDVDSLAGKILRLNRDGAIPSSNPFPDSYRFADGFRNIFGMDLDVRTGQVYVADNGPDCDDEVNLLHAGLNYGWRPEYLCGETSEVFESPLLSFTPSEGPTALKVYYGDTFPELNGKLLYADYNNGRIRVLTRRAGALSVESELVDGAFGSILGIAINEVGEIYFSTPEGIYRIHRE